VLRDLPHQRHAGAQPVTDQPIHRRHVWGDQAGKSRGRGVVRAGQGGLHMVLGLNYREPRAGSSIKRVTKPLYVLKSRAPLKLVGG
jgi:hypothetical protein